MKQRRNPCSQPPSVYRELGMHHEWPAVPDPDFEIREGVGGVWGPVSPKNFCWSKNKGGPGSTTWIRHWPVGKAIVDLPTRLKGNSKSTTQSVGGPEQGSQRRFAGVTSEGLVTSVTLPRADYIGLSFTLENFPDNQPSCPHSWSITLHVTP